MNIYLIGFIVIVAILLTLLFYLIMNTKGNKKTLNKYFLLKCIT